MRRRPQGRRRSVDRGTRRPAIELRNQVLRGADAVNRSGRQHRRSRHRQAGRRTPRSRRPCACVETLCTGTGRSLRYPPDGAAGRPEKANGRTSGMHACGKSDDCVVPGKPPNKGVLNAACGDGGGKAIDQGEHDVDGRVPDSEPDQRVDLSSPCAVRGLPHDRHHPK